MKREYIVKYHTDYKISPFEMYRTQDTVKLQDVWFDHDVLYGYRNGHNVFTLSHDRIEEITDINAEHAYIDIDASFKAQEIAYFLPF